jgi:hypothetical protein
MCIGRAAFSGKGVIVIFVFEQEKQFQPFFQFILLIVRAARRARCAARANRVPK